MTKDEEKRMVLDFVKIARGDYDRFPREPHKPEPTFWGPLDRFIDRWILGEK